MSRTDLRALSTSANRNGTSSRANPEPPPSEPPEGLAPPEATGITGARFGVCGCRVGRRCFVRLRCASGFAGWSRFGTTGRAVQEGASATTGCAAGAARLSSSAEANLSLRRGISLAGLLLGRRGARRAAGALLGLRARCGHRGGRRNSSLNAGRHRSGVDCEDDIRLSHRPVVAGTGYPNRHIDIERLISRIDRLILRSGFLFLILGGGLLRVAIPRPVPVPVRRQTVARDRRRLCRRLRASAAPRPVPVPVLLDRRLRQAQPATGRSAAPGSRSRLILRGRSVDTAARLPARLRRLRPLEARPRPISAPGLPLPRAAIAHEAVPEAAAAMDAAP